MRNGATIILLRRPCELLHGHCHSLCFLVNDNLAHLTATPIVIHRAIRHASSHIVTLRPTPTCIVALRPTPTCIGALRPFPIRTSILLPFLRRCGLGEPRRLNEVRRPRQCVVVVVFFVIFVVFSAIDAPEHVEILLDQEVCFTSVVTGNTVRLSLAWRL